MIRFKDLLKGALLIGATTALTNLGMSNPIPKKLNVIIFTADDLGPDGTGIGACGAKIKGITPNLDKIANEGLVFTHAHVNNAICMPSRGIIATGRYGHNSKHHGFFYANKEVPTMMESFQKGGYKIGVLGKVSHSSAKSSTNWDYVYDYNDLGCGRSPQKYYERTKAFIEKCNHEEKPFYFMINSHDPHRPFQKPDGELLNGAEWPSKMYSPDDVFVPGFLPDLPEVREEMSHYYNSVRRLDDTFGKVMQAIKETGVENNTMIIFLSDNGIAMPFSKANCYLKSTKTAFFVHLPGLVKSGLDDEHFISAVDLFPTIMEVTGLPKPEGLDGRSFLSLLKGKNQKKRESVYTQIDYLNGKAPRPMRCVQDENFGYIFNPWSDGKARYRNANEGETFKAMEEKGKTDPAIQARVELFRKRTLEEFYDLKNDPNCLHNLVNDKAYIKQVEKYREMLREWMVNNTDPLLETFDNRDKFSKMVSIRARTYQNELKHGVRQQKEYKNKIKVMMKNNFE